MDSAASGDFQCGRLLRMDTQLKKSEEEAREELQASLRVSLEA